MHLANIYLKNRLIYTLLDGEGYELIYVSDSTDEIWIKKSTGTETHMIRCTIEQFDWKQEWIRNIQHVEEEFLKKQTFFTRKNVIFHHVLINDYKPIGIEDNPQVLHTENISKKTYTYFLDSTNISDTLPQLEKNINANASIQIEFPAQLLELEALSRYFHSKIISHAQLQQKQAMALFQQAKPWISYVLLIPNLILFILMEIEDSSMSPETLIDYGAKYNPAILDGEWWRLFTSMFLHIGVFHLIMNMLALIFVGSLVERIYGNSRYLFIYFCAGIIGSLASFAFNASIAAGASGAIFGLFGALLYFGLKNKEVFFKTIGWNVIFIVILNVLFGLSVPQIDNGAHLGGMLAGFISAGVVSFPKKKEFLRQTIMLVFLVTLGIGLLVFGVNNDQVQYQEHIQLQWTQDNINKGNNQKAIDAVTKTLPYADEFEAELLFYRSYAYLQIEEYELARGDLLEVISIKNNFPEAHYNLALIYKERGDRKEAIQQIEMAIEQNGEEDMYQNLYDQLLVE
ncbi:rhomboid family protein [Saliterribacillus persicus]|uniref:Rhomboid family peptidase n=1 Tax=Saliterribacillus persicus TaxID=930114 RepID=A0A368XBP2_9BACI|nr:rhomboid family intramembrane serine protease [Saliterribacillus persicus]RCW65370.1 rhomboid family peptidase [Saliterribacillus persicus]